MFPVSSPSSSAGRSLWYSVWHRYKKNKLAMVGLILMFILILASLSAGVFIDYSKVTAISAGNRLLPPSSRHWLGTDNYGRDIFARIIYGSRVSLSVGLITVVCSLATGGFIGAVAGYFGGKVDEILMRIMDIMLAIPSIILAICFVAALGSSVPNLVVALTLSRMPQFSRVVRAAVLPIKNQEYIEAAAAFGTSSSRIILKHILPNVLGPIIVQATLQVGSIILSIAGLSFIGLGIQPPTPELGSMLSDLRAYMRTHPFLVIPPGVAIMLTVFSFNRIGDGLRDALDPKLRN
ncbi:MAG: ABC transporter permease [Synergistaceae bacterium]|nr:ABC transporter permease [Synergistaceae bacterium]